MASDLPVLILAYELLIFFKEFRWEKMFRIIKSSLLGARGCEGAAWWAPGSQTRLSHHSHMKPNVFFLGGQHEVVALGTGECNYSQHFERHGRVLHDSHAIVIARRSLLR